MFVDVLRSDCVSRYVLAKASVATKFSQLRNVVSDGHPCGVPWLFTSVDYSLVWLFKWMADGVRRAIRAELELFTGFSHAFALEGEEIIEGRSIVEPLRELNPSCVS